MSDNPLAWLTLHRAGVSPAELPALLNRFGSITAAVNAGDRDLRAHTRTKRTLTDAAADDATQQWLEDPKNALVTWDHPAYPRLLREIADPPLVLFVCGDVACLSLPQLAIVGSRTPTPIGIENAEAFAASLAKAGCCITSGLALGIDAAAHRGALSVGGRTLAISGTGLDRVYPANHRELAHEIANNGGALVSEFPLGMAPRKENFPRRNRVISGLALGTLVVEAALKSGSLITARLAAEQGREVFAIPGSIHSPLARGCHALIRQGAKLVETAQDIVEELVTQLPDEVSKAEVVDRPEDESVALDAASSSLLAHIGYDLVDIDTLVERTGLTPDRISSMLLKMELQGVVAAGAGGRYQRTTKKAYP